MRLRDVARGNVVETSTGASIEVDHLRIYPEPLVPLGANRYLVASWMRLPLDGRYRTLIVDTTGRGWFGVGRRGADDVRLVEAWRNGARLTVPRAQLLGSLGTWRRRPGA